MFQNTIAHGSTHDVPQPQRRRIIEQGKHYVLDRDDDAPYDIRRTLGFGHSAAVEEVIDIHTGAVYARKVIWLHAGERARRQRIFEQEAEIIRNLAGHHHIIRVFATYYAEPKVFLILQPVATSGDLEVFLRMYREDRELQQHSQVSHFHETNTRALQQAFGCLANGLAFMHQRRVRHKDIKSKNILVHEGSVIYTDFGYSKDFSASETSTSEGPLQHVTRRYSAPEVLDHDTRNSLSDVYSLGCVYFEILYALLGVPVIDQNTLYSMDAPRLREEVYASGISGTYLHLAELAISMTSKHATERPSSFDVSSRVRTYPGFLCGQCASLPEINPPTRSPGPALLHVPNIPGLRTPLADVPTIGIGGEVSGQSAFSSDLTIPGGQSQYSPHSMVFQRLHDPVDSGNSGTPSWPQPMPRTLSMTLPNVIQGTQGHGWSETLDSSYRMRTDIEANEFFKVGRVFQMLHQEGTSANMARSGPYGDNSSDTWVTIVQYGLQSFSQNRRFVVVDVDKNNSVSRACSITTYGNEGCLSQDCEAEAHAIVYFSGTNAISLPGEFEAGMTRDPIEVMPADEGLSMEKTARIRFSKTYSVPWNARVKDIGRVHPNDKSSLLAYWREYETKAISSRHT